MPDHAPPFVKVAAGMTMRIFSLPFLSTLVAVLRGRHGAFWSALSILLVTRLALILSFEITQFSDLGWYLSRASEMLATGRYAEGGVSTAYWPVGYPAFLAGLMMLFGRNAMVGQLGNLLLSAMCLWILYRYCVVRFSDQRVANVAVWLLALYPNHMGYSVGLYSEPLFTLLLLWVVTYTHPNLSLGRVAAMGVLIGLATLVKAQMLLLGPILLMLLSLRDWSGESIRRALYRAVFATLFMAMTILPWTYRNLIVMGAPIPVSTNGGMSLLAGNNPSMTLSLNTDFTENDPIQKAVEFSVADQVAADQRAKSAAMEWIMTNPGKFLSLMPKKLFRLWAPDGESEWVFEGGYAGYQEHRVVFRAVRILNQGFYFILIFGFLFAIIKNHNFRKPNYLVVPMLFLYFSVVSMVFSGQSRYHAPLMPFIIAYAAFSYIYLRYPRKIN